MSVSSMGVRSALRQFQDLQPEPEGAVVVSALAVPPAAGQAPAATPSAPQGAPTNPVSPLAEWVEKLTAWIPTESLTLWVAFAGFFSVFDKTRDEFALVAAVAVLTGLWAYAASTGAQRRRTPDSVSKEKAYATCLLSIIAFLVWWTATPGSWVTTDLDVPALYTALLLVATVAVLPYVARKFGVEPLRAIVAAP